MQVSEKVIVKQFELELRITPPSSITSGSAFENDDNSNNEMTEP